MNKRRILIGLYCVIFIVGIVMIMKSVPYGHNAAFNSTSEPGDSFLVEIEGYIASFRNTGTVLAILSGFGLLFEAKKVDTVTGRK